MITFTERITRPDFHCPNFSQLTGSEAKQDPGHWQAKSLGDPPHSADGAGAGFGSAIRRRLWIGPNSATGSEEETRWTPFWSGIPAGGSVNSLRSNLPQTFSISFLEELRSEFLSFIFSVIRPFSVWCYFRTRASISVHCWYTKVIAFRNDRLIHDTHLVHSCIISRASLLFLDFSHLFYIFSVYITVWEQVIHLYLLFPTVAVVINHIFIYNNMGPGGGVQEYCLRWNNHHSTLVSVMDALLQKGTLVDVTLAAEGKSIQVHRLVLCACSNYFQVSPISNIGLWGNCGILHETFCVIICLMLLDYRNYCLNTGTSKQ